MPKSLKDLIINCKYNNYMNKKYLTLIGIFNSNLLFYEIVGIFLITYVYFNKDIIEYVNLLIWVMS